MDGYIYVCGCVHIYEYINKMQSTSNQKGDKVVAGSLFIYYFFLFCFVFFLFKKKHIYIYRCVFNIRKKKKSLLFQRFLNGVYYKYDL